MHRCFFGMNLKWAQRRIWIWVYMILIRLTGPKIADKTARVNGTQPHTHFTRAFSSHGIVTLSMKFLLSFVFLKQETFFLTPLGWPSMTSVKLNLLHHSLLPMCKSIYVANTMASHHLLLPKCKSIYITNTMASFTAEITFLDHWFHALYKCISPMLAYILHY